MIDTSSNPSNSEKEKAALKKFVQYAEELINLWENQTSTAISKSIHKRYEKLINLVRENVDDAKKLIQAEPIVQ
jgi:gas vesicle protein